MDPTTRPKVFHSTLQFFSMVFVLVAVALVSTAATGQERAEEGVEFVRLDWPDDQIRRFPESCPVRLELPLNEFFEEGDRRFETEKVQAVQCEGAYVDSLGLRRLENDRRDRQGRLDTSKREGEWLVVKADVWVPKGKNRELAIHYRLMKGSEEIAADGEEFYGDEGELNWDDGVRLWLGPQTFASLDGEDIVLLVELEVADVARD